MSTILLLFLSGLVPTLASQGGNPPPPGPPAPDIRQFPIGPQPLPRPEPGREPKIVFQRLSHDFGEVDEGREVTTTFEFKNEGKGPLVIQRIEGKCSCTSPGVDVDGRLYSFGTPIPPGSTGVVRAVVKTAGFVNDKDTGLNVYTNDPTFEESEDLPFGVVPVKIHLKIVRRFAFEPEPLLEFGEISVSEGREAHVVLRSMKGEPFQILGFEGMEKDLARYAELRAEPTDDTAMAWKIVGTLSASAPFGPFQKEVKVLTKPEAPATTFRIRGNVFGPVKVEPAQIHFIVVAKGRVASKSIFVRSTHAGLPLKISNVRLLDPNDHRALTGGPASLLESPVKDHLKIDVTETDPGKVAKLDVVLRDTMPAMKVHAVLAFDTGIPGASPNGSTEVRVLITGLVR